MRRYLCVASVAINDDRRAISVLHDLIHTIKRLLELLGRQILQRSFANMKRCSGKVFGMRGEGRQREICGRE